MAVKPAKPTRTAQRAKDFIFGSRLAHNASQPMTAAEREAAITRNDRRDFTVGFAPKRLDQ